MKLESTVQNKIRVEAANLGFMLWRNNSGACYNEEGRLIRYGLGNESVKINRRIKSSDLIGFFPVIVTPEMVGKQLAIFTAIECKEPNWKGVSNDREVAQEKFLKIVKDGGGLGGFSSHPSDLYRILGEINR